MITLAELKLQVRQRADQVNSRFVEDLELVSYINNSYKELYDLLVSSFNDYYMKDVTDFADSEGTVIIPNDFYKLLGVDVSINNNHYLPLLKWQFIDRNQSNRSINSRFLGISNLRYRLMANKVRLIPEEQAEGLQVKLWYIPKASLLINDVDTIDDVNGFDEYIIVDAAIKCLIKEESDVSTLLIIKSELKARIENMAQNRDAGLPERVSDVSTNNFNDDDNNGFGF